jgi:polar amino acid transport system substrate-binding protein
MKWIAIAALLFTAGCTSFQNAPPAAVSDLAPSGKLRAAINFGNPVLASRDAQGQPKGVSVDLATELAKRLGVPLEVVPFQAAGKVVEAGKANLWDIGFVALDPARAEDIAQSPPYVVIEGAYLVREKSSIRSNAEVDRAGNRIVVGPRSAYDLYLSRTLKQAKIVHAPSSPLVVDFYLKGDYEVAAGVKQQLEADAKKNPGVRILPGRFMVINQAMASQRAKPAGAKYVREFIEDMKASGFVARALERHGIQGAGVAPAGDAKE